MTTSGEVQESNHTTYRTILAAAETGRASLPGPGLAQKEVRDA
jgi:hypothetical protein